MNWRVGAFFIISFFFLQETGFCQSARLSGTLSFDDGSPVAFATISIPTINSHAISNDKGRYELVNIPYGTYQIEISSVEIKKTTQNIKVNSAKETSNFVLDRAEANVLNEVVVEGESVKREIETKGFAVNVIEMKKASLQSVQTNDILNRTAGVRVRQNGGIGSAVNYNLNGMSGNSVRVFIDGLPASTYGASFSLNSIPPSLIERIEVYKGVIPAHLADDALGGAINVVLKRSINNTITASVSYGSFNTFQSNFNGVYRDHATGFTVKASGFYNYSDNDYEVWGKFVRNILPNGRYDYVRVKRFNDTYRSGGGQIAMGFTGVKWADLFFVNYTGSDDYNEIQHGTYMSIPYYGRFTTSQSHAAGLSYLKDDLFIPGLELSFNGTLSNRSQIVNDTVKWNYNWYGERSLGLDGNPILRPQGAQQGAPTLNHIDRQIATFRSGLTYKINENHKVVFSHSFFRIDREQQDEKLSLIEREFVGTRDLEKNISSLGYELNLFKTRLKGSFFAKHYQQKINRMDPILVEENGVSVRSEDRISSQRNAAGFGTAISFTAHRYLVILSSAEQAVRMPSENEIFGSPGDNIVENVGINPEISNNINLGFKAGAFTLGDHQVSLSATGFVRDTKDKIVQRINPRINDAVQTNPFENLGKTRAKGFEAQIEYGYKKGLKATLNMSKFNAVYNTKYDPNGNIYDNYNQQLPNEPFLTVNGSVDYTFTDFITKNGALNLSYYFGFVEKFYTTWLEIEDFRTPRQFVHDIGASYTFPKKKMVVSVDARNIFDQQVYDNFAVQKPGRAFYLKLNYTINKF